MLAVMRWAFAAWHRRHWRADPAKCATFAGLRPVVVVTGGSEGIGFAIAKRFAMEGYDLLLVAREAGKLEAARLTLAGKSRVGVLALDVTAGDACSRLDAGLARDGAYADILVNSAGVGLAGAFVEHDPAALANLLDLNIRALTLLTRHCLPGMIARGRGGVLNVASIGAYTPGPWQAAYYASKAYVVAFTEAIAAEVAGQGVRVTAVLPGAVTTEFHRRMAGDSALYLRVMPLQAADRVAACAVRGFLLHARVIVPGLHEPILALALRVMPHRLSSALVGFLLKPR